MAAKRLQGEGDGDDGGDDAEGCLSKMVSLCDGNDGDFAETGK